MKHTDTHLGRTVRVRSVDVKAFERIASENRLTNSQAIAVLINAWHMLTPGQQLAAIRTNASANEPTTTNPPTKQTRSRTPAMA